MLRIGKVLAVLAAVAIAATPVASADARFVTVTLPAGADLTTYGWCTPLGCDQPLRVRTPLPAVVYRAMTSDAADPRRTVAMDTYGLGAWATTEAVRRLQNSPSSVPTTVAAVLLRTPTRPNGGLFTRVDGRLSTPAANFNAFGGGAPPGAVVDTSFVDVAREYDGLTDFPSWFNPFAVVNAMVGAVFLRDYADTFAWRDPRCPGGTCTAPATWPVRLPSESGYVYAVARVPDPDDPSRTIDVTSPLPVGVVVIPTTGDQTVYYTQLTSTLPLLMPLQWPFEVVNDVVAAATHGAVSLHLVNPLVQILQPALTILVNVGYPDVDPSAGYTRTLTDPAEPVPFGTRPGLTPAQWAEVPGAVGRALLAGFSDAVSNPFGIRDTTREPLAANGRPGQRHLVTRQLNSRAEERRDSATPSGTGTGPPTPAVEPQAMLRAAVNGRLGQRRSATTLLDIRTDMRRDSRSHRTAVRPGNAEPVSHKKLGVRRPGSSRSEPSRARADTARAEAAVHSKSS